MSFVKLRRLQLRWILRRNNVGNAQRDDVRKSYEFTLNHVGQDKDSGEIWSDYIQFLQSGEVCYLSRPSSDRSSKQLLTGDNDMGRTTEDGCPP